VAGKKKPANWAAIKKRYLQDESPISIAKDYEVTPKSIQNKAYRENWTSLKKKIQVKVVEKLESEFEQIGKALLREYQRVAFSNMSRIAYWNSSGVDFKDANELSEDDTACVSEISESTNQHGGSLKVKLHNKLGAMDSLAEIVGLVKKDKEKEPEIPDSKPIEAMDNLEIMDRIKRITGE